MSHWSAKEQNRYYAGYYQRPEVKKRLAIWKKKRRQDAQFIWKEFLRRIKRQYHLTEADYLKFLYKYKGKCFNVACKNQYTAIDHDHKTGLVRGLLCTQCNIALGQLKEDSALIDGLKQYMGFFV